MPYQNIEATVTAADLKAVKDAFASIRAKLSFLVSLTAEERQKLFKTGANSLAFVQNSLQAAKNNPDILPGSFKVAGFESDVNLFAVLTDVHAVAQQLATELDDTRMAVGSEAITGAADVYNYVKAAAKSTPGLKAVAEQLGERFQKTKGPKPPPDGKA